MTTESFRKNVAKQLSDLQNDPDETSVVSFPADLTSTDRKYIHKLAESFNLYSLSEGVGDERRLAVYKTRPEGKAAKPEARAFTPNLVLSLGERNCLKRAAAAVTHTVAHQALAHVRPVCQSSRKPKLSRPQFCIGDHVESYWPDDNDWLEAIIMEDYEDGTYRICWETDSSESVVPNDYVRRVTGLPDGLAMKLQTLEEALARRRKNPEYSRIMGPRESLPAFKQRGEVVTGISEHQVVLLSGETGCGKSTQVPQLVLDSCPSAKILVMQPRKIAAMTLAERVASERCQRLGTDVGYQVPFAAISPNARLCFTTLGNFRTRLLNDTDLTGITHVIFDEVHERDRLADFNMIFMKDLLERRTDLRLVLMSATLQLETFEAYFPGCHKVQIPGRVFPVNELYLDEITATLHKNQLFKTWLGPGILCGGIEISAGAEGDWNEKVWKQIVFQHTKPEDRDSLWGLRDRGLESQMMAPFTKTRLLDGLRKHDVLQQSGLDFDYPIIEALVLHIDRMFKEQLKKQKEAGEEEKPPGTILVFLPGWGEIDRLQKRLLTNLDAKRFKILPLHSQVSSEQQSEVFEPSVLGVRKIVLTTNIAEASITVEGTEFVIDSGRAKEVSYDPYLKVGMLTTSWISQASAKQRAGRAGRTRGGLCFHLFCHARHEKMDEYLPPELLRSPLEDSALTGKLMLLKMGSTEKVSSFLARAPTPPEGIAIANSIQELVQLGALTSSETLTVLGEHLTKSQLPPRLKKTLLWGILLGCLEDVLAVVSAASGITRDPFRMQSLPREEAQKVRFDLAHPHNSDHVCLLNVVNGFTDALNQQAYCDKHHLQKSVMRSIRDAQNKLYVEIQENKSEGFANRNRGNVELVTAVLCGGIFPNMARRKGDTDYFEVKNGKVEARVHASSAHIPDKADEWVFFQELTQVESNFKMKFISPVEPITLLLLGGDGPLIVKESTSIGGKGAKTNKGGGQVVVSLLDEWIRFKTDEQTAERLQEVRTSLNGAFQEFIQRPGSVPPAETLSFLDSVIGLFCKNRESAEEEVDDDDDGDEATPQAPSRGIKRAASWGPCNSRYIPAPKTTPIRPAHRSVLLNMSGGKGAWPHKGSAKGGRGYGRER